ncbi:hypothetical protein [Kingella potus]|nr:hypothetical protein [Kingella potus]
MKSPQPRAWQSHTPYLRGRLKTANGIASSRIRVLTSLKLRFQTA